jgi:O-antigen ligase
MWVSHSSYLDAGLAGGFPGMALFGWFVLKPIWKLWPRRREAVIGWLLAVYAVSIISIGSSSAMQYKYFWMLWGMAAVCFLPAVTKVKNRRKRQKIEGGEQPGEIGEAISRAKENEEESVRGQESVVGGR